MKGHRSGHPVVTCDGCYEVIEKQAPPWPLQVLNADGTRLDCCGLEECKDKIRAKHDPPYRCPNCVTLGQNVEGCDHKPTGRPDSEYGEVATPSSDVIY